MKSNKKAKQTVFLTIQKPTSKPQTSKPTNAIPTNEYKRLLQYRDYLLSLRKMDLGSLIHKNNHRKNQQSPRLDESQSKKHTCLTAVKQKQTFPQSTHISHTNPEQIKPQKIKQITLTKQKFKNQSQPQQIKLENPTIEEVKRQRKNAFKLQLKSNFQQDDLYCNEDMQELMNNHRPRTPKLIHIGNFSNYSGDRDFSTHRSSRCRDFSMPSIQQRVLSEQSQDSLSIKDKNCPRSISDSLNHRKYSSCNHSSPIYDDKDFESKQKSKKKSFIAVPLSSRTKTKQQSNQNFDKENLISTQDKNSDSGDRSSRLKQRNNLDVKINPFNFKLQLNQQKQHQKLALNVSQIVKRINSRQSKSSMSDRSYRKKHDNTQHTNQPQKSKQLHDQFYADTIKEKIAQINFDHSRIMVGKNNIHEDQTVKKKSFKTQVKQFREKHYLMMKLGQ